MATRRQPTHSTDYVDGAAQLLSDEPPVLDLMNSNVAAFIGRGADIEVISEREFGNDPEGMLQYEKFMQDPIVIVIHATGDKTASPTPFIGVNGDQRWLPREIPIRLQRKFIERLAQSQEMHFTTEANPDPRADTGMLTKSRNVAAYGFSVEHDPAGDLGKRWLRRVTRGGC